MTLTLTLGWWLLPALVTGAVWGWAIAYCVSPPKPGAASCYGLDVVAALVVALFVSMFAWLVYLGAVVAVTR